MDDEESRQYRRIIDTLVGLRDQHVKLDLADLVNRNADTEPPADTPDWMRDTAAQRRREARAVNRLIAGLGPDERAVLACLLTQSYEAGVFETVRTLYEEGVVPFDKGYEGNPFNDLVGRFDDWPWPEGRPRWG